MLCLPAELAKADERTAVTGNFKQNPVQEGGRRSIKVAS